MNALDCTRNSTGCLVNCILNLATRLFYGDLRLLTQILRLLSQIFRGIVETLHTLIDAASDTLAGSHTTGRCIEKCDCGSGLNSHGEANPITFCTHSASLLPALYL